MNRLTPFKGECLIQSQYRCENEINCLIIVYIHKSHISKKKRREMVQNEWNTVLIVVDDEHNVAAVA